MIEVIVDKRSASQRGVTLIELMIAMVIGFFLVGVVMSLYFNMRTSFRYQETFSRLQENGRFSLDMLARDIRMAGYNGCGDLTDLANVVNGGATNPFLNFTTPVIGYEGGVSTFPTEITAAGAIAGTDAIILLGVDTSSELVVQGHNPPSAQINTNVHSIKPGEILLITDCSHASVFQITGPTNNNNNATNVVHNTGTGTPGNCTKFLGASCPSSKSYQYKPGASMLRVYSNAYFIAPASSGNGRSLWTMALAGSSGTPIARELIEGVEDLQITYGLDLSPKDRSADKFLTADQVASADWKQVVAVRPSLLLKSAKDDVTTKPQVYEYNGISVTPTDRNLRKVFIDTVTVRNRTP